MEENGHTRDTESLDPEVEQLRHALESRSVVGQAMGILMERFDLDDVAAFHVLARYSSTSNRKLRQVAAELVATRELPHEAFRTNDDACPDS